MDAVQRAFRTFSNRRQRSRARSKTRAASPSSTSASSSSLSPNLRTIQAAPHPIAAGDEGKLCPISGLFADAKVLETGATSVSALEALQSDPDIAEEMRALKLTSQNDCKEEVVTAVAKTVAPQPVQLVPFNARDGKHEANRATQELVRGVGLPALTRFTESFYQKVFADSHVDKFVASHEDPHHERFALWIQEKFGDGTAWTRERRTRPKRYMKIGDEVVQVAHDRSSAHFAAWNSPKREPHKWGVRFRPDDARVWMRLHFWAARETGMFDEHEAFMEYYTRFIGHFISVYSTHAPPFTRESARWSADPRNVQRYLESGRVMTDVIGKDVASELEKLPAEERVYTGSRARNPVWPYDSGRR